MIATKHHNRKFLITYIDNVDTELCSDHLPIIITLDKTLEKINADGRLYINFNKFNWESYPDGRFLRIIKGTRVIPSNLFQMCSTKSKQY